ncbi:MAG: flagellar hook-length control protein FliK [Candidatus Zixiibacteriota bacterium]
MNAGVMGMNASPFDMILGFGAQTIPQVSSGTGDFGKLMKLFPQFQNMPQTLAGTGDVPIPELMTVAPQELLAEETPMLLTEGLAEKLGLQLESKSEQTVQPTAIAGAEQILTVPVQLAVVEDERNQPQLFLKVPVEAAADDTVPMLITEAHVANEKEMLIPVQLRTVEQEGQRINADALLRTATGESVSVRLKLDVAGTTHVQSLENTLTPETSQSVTVTPQQQRDVVTMLANLGVKSLVVETVEDGDAQPTQQLLPRTVAQQSRSLADLSIEQATTQVDETEGGDAQTRRVTSFAQTSHQDSSTGKDTTFGQSKTDEFSAQMTRVSSENVALSTAEISTENAQTASDAKAPTTSTSVRYYNIDQGLEQLKQNPGQKIQVQLSPATLGKMDLSIINHRGVVTVQLTMESTQAKQAVERNLGQLESHLSSSGIKVDAFHITVNESSRPGSYSGHQFNQQGFFGDRHQGQNFRRYNQQLKQDFNMTKENFQRVMVNCLA